MHRTLKSLTRMWSMMKESPSLMWKMKTKRSRKRKVLIVHLISLNVRCGASVILITVSCRKQVCSYDCLLYKSDE